jgi:hypothetical protein
LRIGAVTIRGTESIMTVRKPSVFGCAIVAQMLPNRGVLHHKGASHRRPCWRESLRCNHLRFFLPFSFVFFVRIRITVRCRKLCISGTSFRRRSAHRRSGNPLGNRGFLQTRLSRVRLRLRNDGILTATQLAVQVSNISHSLPSTRRTAESLPLIVPHSKSSQGPRLSSPYSSRRVNRLDDRGFAFMWS